VVAALAQRAAVKKNGDKGDRKLCGDRKLGSAAQDRERVPLDRQVTSGMKGWETFRWKSCR